MSDEITDATRRTILKAAAGALGVGAMGSAEAHKWQSDGDGDGNENRRPETVGETADNVRNVGYHSVGGRGTESGRGGVATNPHEGGVTEVRVQGDYAYLGMFSSRGDSEGRGMAIVDVSDYNSAQTEEAVDSAEMNVVSFFRNTNAATAIMDVKVSDDGDYVFAGTQPITALFDETPTEPGYDANDRGTSGTNSGGVLAIDVSDPFNPQLVDSADYFNTGIHNLFHHRIDGTDYVFACKDINYGTAGVNVFRFDRAPGTLTQVNRWTVTPDGEGHNNAQGDVTATGGLDFYCHDVEVQDDPVTGRPTLYVAYWNAGVRVLDASDPTALEQIGHFPMKQGHFTTPAPDLVDGKRVLVASHEEPSNDRDGSGDGEPADNKANPFSTGTVFIADADGIYDHVENGEKVEEPSVTAIGELDDWTWQNAEELAEKDDIVFDNFELSPHNSDIAKHVDPDSGEATYWVHQGHYHAGVRFLKLEPGDDDGDEGQVDERDSSDVDWTLSEQGWSRPEKGVPTESTMEGLSDVAPNVWGAVQSNGVTFAADINQGIHAIRNEDVPLGGANPAAVVDRADDGRLYLAGRTNRVELTVVGTRDDAEVLIRDRIPESWDATVGDEYEVVEVGGAKYVEFTESVGPRETLEYFAEVGDATGPYQLGPVQVSADGGDSWHTLSETTDTNYVVGGSTALTLGGTGVGALGAASVLSGDGSDHDAPSDD